MDVDREKTGKALLDDQDTDEEGQSSPQPLEDGGNTTTDDGSEEEPVQRRDLKRPSPSKEAPPPRRELPFTRRGPTNTELKSASDPAGDEAAGETDDDEL